MPQALFVSIGLALESSLGAFLIGNSALLSSGSLLLGGLAYSSAKAKSAKRKARDEFNAAQVNRLANISTTTGPRELVLGLVRKGGNVFFRASTGANKTKFVMAQAIAGHEIDAVEQIYFNDEAITIDSSGNVTSAPYAFGTPTSATTFADASGNATLLGAPVPGTLAAFTGTTAGREGDLVQQLANVVGTAVTTAPNARITYQYLLTSTRARVRWVLGAPDQAADSRLISLFPGLWTAAHRARAVAYLICEFDYDETAFPTGLPNVTAVVRGAKLYDPRTGGTAWSENPALMVRHVYAHPAFGKGTPTAEEDARIAAAATACDTSHSYVVGGVTTTTALYRAALVAPFGTAAKDVFDDLTQAMAGAWAYAGGQLYLKPGTWTPSVMSLTEADLADVVRTGASQQDIALNIVVHREQAQKFNTVTPTIWDADQGYKQTPLTPLPGAALVARDGKTLAQAVTMPAVGHAGQALHIAGVLMRDARDPLTVTLSFKLKAYPLELFDTIALTIAHYGWSSKLFMVVGRDWTADGNLSLTLKETAEAIYTPDAAFSAQGYAANTQLPSPWYVPQVGELTVSSGTAELLKLSDGSILTRMRVSWPAIDDASVTEGGTIEVQYRAVLSDGPWERDEVPGSVTQTVIGGVQDANAYTIRARARSRLAVGLWSAQVVHTVLGKTEPPPIFDRFLVLAQPDGTRQIAFGYSALPPVDWLGAQIRYLAGTHASPDWDSMTVLSEQDTHYTASPIEVNVPPAGTYTFACKSVDRSGNLSPYRLQTITLPDRRLGSVFDEWDEFIDGWAGTLTDCLINASGYIEAIDTTTWSTTPSDWDSWTRWNQNPSSPIYYETPARDLGGVVTGQISVVLDADGSTTVELATSADGISWSSWGSVSGTFSAQWIKLRVTVTATGPQPVPVVRGFSWLVDAPLVREYVNDIDISTLTGSYRIGTGDVRMPLLATYTLIKRSGVVVQDSSGGEWTAVRVDNSLSPSPRWQFRLAGTLADPEFVDFYVEGFAS
jgi:hypothetical protein